MSKSQGSSRARQNTAASKENTLDGSVDAGIDDPPRSACGISLSTGHEFRYCCADFTAIPIWCESVYKPTTYRNMKAIVVKQHREEIWSS